MNFVNVEAIIPKFDIAKLDTSTPVLILGGKENALSLVRRFGKLGIKTRVSGSIDCWGMHSRYCTEKFIISPGQEVAQYWHELLLSGKNARLRGSLIINCSDNAIEFVAQHRTELAKNYLLDHCDGQMQLALLDKKKTMELAREAGIATPNFWQVKCENELGEIRKDIRFPVMVKPVLSHEFISVFGRKLFIIEESFDELTEKLQLSWANNLEVMIVEMIPGPDSLLSSYYTYIDDKHKVQFDYTKRVIRRFPVNRGLGCYHASQWLPKTAKAGRKFFQGIGFTGLGNIEFKLDTRDGQLKIIESNARFTAAQELVIQSGAPIDLICYCCATKQPAPKFSDYNQTMTYWYAMRDFLAFIEMRKNGQITTGEWIKSVFPMRHVSPLHRLSDPYPTIRALSARIDKVLRSLF